MKTLSLVASALIAALPLARATTVVNDVFSGASTINNTGPTPSTPGVAALAYQQLSGKTFSPNPPTLTSSGLKFGIVSTSSGFNHVQALFSKYPVTLVNDGEYIELQVVFTSEGGIITAQANSTLFFGLFDAGQVQPKPGGMNATVGTATAGYAQGWKGYVSNIFYTGGTNAFYTRPAMLATDANNQDLLYNYVASKGSLQVGSTASSTLAALTAGNAYTEVYRITKASATTATLSSSLYAGTSAIGTPLFSLTTTSSSTPINLVFDGLAFGWRATGSVVSGMTVTQVKVTTTGTTTIVPAITTQPISMTKSIGESVTLSVVADGGAGTALTYQWKKGGVDIGGATGASYTVSSLTAEDAGDYTVVVTDIAGFTTSSPATLTVSAGAVAPSLSVQPGGGTILVGGSHTFSITASGTEPLSYQWEKGSVGGSYSAIGGATGASYTVGPATLADAGSYRCVVTNAQGSATSSAADLAVNQAPSITTQPTGVSLNPGTALTLSVVATGTPAPTYQWKKDGFPLAGATSSTYSVGAISSIQAGNYTVVVTNSVGSVTSNTASVVVLSYGMAATATTPGAAPCNPDARLTITFNEPVTAGISGVIRIRKASDDSIVDSVDLAAATTLRDTLRGSNALSVLLLPVASKPIGGIANNFNYYPITVSGNTATFYPRNGVLSAGNSYYVTVEPGVFLNASGESFAGITSKTAWAFSTKASVPVAGAPSYIVAADGSGDFNTLQAAIDFVPAGNTAPVLINLKKGVYFEMVGISGKHAITILGEDMDQTVLQYPNNNTFNNVSGIYHRAVLVGDNVHDIVIANLTINNTTPQGGTQAEALSLKGNSATTSRNIVTRCKFNSYQDTIMIGRQAYVSDCVITGDVDFMWGDGPIFFENCDFKILRTGGYFTQVRNPSGNHGFVFHNCRFTAGADFTGSYLGRIDPGASGYPYSEVVLLDSVIGDATNNAFLNTTYGISGSSYAAGWWLLNNSTGPAVANPTMHNWSNNLKDGTGAALSSPGTEPFTVMPGDATTQANYRNPTWVLNTSISGTVNGSWTPGLAPVIVNEPASATVDSGKSASFSVVAVGVPTATYQWKKDGSVITGATSATYTIAACSAADAGGYTVVITNSAGTVTSGAATLGVTGVTVSPAIQTQPSGASMALGTSYTLSVSASGTAPLSYQWMKDNVAISGASSPSYTISNANSASAGSYTVVVSNAGGSATSNAAVITIKPSATIQLNGYAADVTGGTAGTTVVVSNAADLKSYAESSTAYTIIVSGIIDLGASGRIKPKSNRTIRGADIDATVLGTIELSGVDNVIISNLNVSANTGAAATNDGITITGSTRVLVTKCTIFDCTDGNLDVVGGSDLVTISWCKFYYTRNNGHNFSNLIGSADDDVGTGDGRSNYRVTWHHNWWSTGAMQRMLACRFGRAHMFNNYWDCAGNDYCTESRNIASVLSEHNHYDGVHNPLAKRTALPNDQGLLMTINVLFSNCTGTQLTSSDAIFVPPYSYRLEPVDAVKAVVKAGAGNVAVDTPSWSSGSISGSATRIYSGGSATLTATPSGFTPVAYQWRFRNSALSGKTASTLVLSGAALSDAGDYSVGMQAADGSWIMSSPFSLAVDSPSVGISTASTTVTAGQAFSLEALVAGVTATGYQWKLNGVDISGANSPSYQLPHVQSFHAGTYSIVVTHSGGSLTSGGTAITVTAAAASAARVTVLSTRAISGTDDSVLIPGFIIKGTGTKRILARAVGPALFTYGVTGYLPNPRMVLKRLNAGNNSWVDVSSNDDWGQAANAATIASTTAALQAFPLPGGSLDAALLADLDPGTYTVVADGVAGGTGIALVELYDTDSAGATAQLTAISNRGRVEPGERVMIPGIIVSNEGSRSYLIRAVGPRLADFGVTNCLANPQFVIHGTKPVTNEDYIVVANDDWGQNPEAANTAAVATQLQAFDLKAGSKDAALVVTLPPGAYTVVASGVGGSSGVALVEVYLVPTGTFE